MKFSIDITEEEMQEIFTDISQKKVKRIIAQYLETALNKVRKSIEESVEAAVDNSLPDLKKTIQRATERYRDEY